MGATNCATRLRVEVADPSIVADNATFVAAGAKGLIVTGKTAQVIIGVSVPRVKEHFDQIMGLEPGFAFATPLSHAADDAKKHGNICFFDIDGTLAWQDPKLAQELPEGERDLSPYPNETVAQAIRTLSPTATKPLSARGAPSAASIPSCSSFRGRASYVSRALRRTRGAHRTKCGHKPGLLQRLAPYLEQSGEVIRFEASIASCA